MCLSGGGGGGGGVLTATKICKKIPHKTSQWLKILPSSSTNANIYRHVTSKSPMPHAVCKMVVQITYTARDTWTPFLCPPGGSSHSQMSPAPQRAGNQ